MNYKEWFETINKNNKAFSKANKARKRVILAKDIIKALQVDLFKVTNGYYMSGFFAHGNEDARDYLVEKNPKCNVCAKGAILACAIMRRDKLTATDVNMIEYRYTSSLSKALGGIFDQEQLNLIESHFECDTFLSYSCRGSPFRKYAPGKNRLLAIMLNVIKHSGTFKPELEN